MDKESAQAIAARCRMLETDKPSSKDVLLFLEGGDDFNVFSKFINAPSVSLVNCKGKPTALKASKLYSEQGGQRTALCVVDADADHILKPGHDSNVFVTDDFDLTSMIFKSPAFDDIIRNKKLAWDPSKTREIILRKCVLLGKLRLINTIEDWGLSFQKSGSLFHHSSYDCENIDHVLQVVEKHNPHIFSEKDIINKFKSHTMFAHNYTQGHDICKAAESYFRMYKSPINNIEGELSKHYDSGYFKSTQLFLNLNEWAANKNVLLFNPHLF